MRHAQPTLADPSVPLRGCRAEGAHTDLGLVWKKLVKKGHMGGHAVHETQGKGRLDAPRLAPASLPAPQWHRGVGNAYAAEGLE